MQEHVSLLLLANETSGLSKTVVAKMMTMQRLTFLDFLHDMGAVFDKGVTEDLDAVYVRDIDIYEDSQFEQAEEELQAEDP
eukprot:3114998-Amphidinium_carterae.1